MTGRQLALPCLPRVVTPPRDRRKRAKRDFSAAEFERALTRNGFMQAYGGLSFIDSWDADAEWIEGVVRQDPIRIARRATLAKLLRLRKESHRESQ